MRIGKVVERVSPVGKLGGLVGVDGSDTVAQLGRLLQGDTSPTAERNLLARNLQEAGQRILVVLDDLDRLAPAELLLVFKLVRFVGRLPNVFYLLSYDERTLLDVLARTELCGDNEKRARDYLEKIVQVRLDLPPLRARQAERLLLESMAELATDLGVDSPEGHDRFTSAYEGCLRHWLTTPRAINRYRAQVDALYTILGEEVDFHDFALLTFIRTSEPRLYAGLYRIRAEIAVDRPRSAEYGKDEDDALRWRELVAFALSSGDREAARESLDGVEVTGMVELLSSLFPLIAGSGRKGAVSGDEVRSVARRKGVGHSDYVDRYFSFGVPDDDIADAKVGELLTQLSAGEGDTDLAYRLMTDTDRIVRKLDLRRSRDEVTTRALIELVGRHFGGLSDMNASDRLSSRTVAQRFAQRLVTELPNGVGDVLDRLDGSLARVRACRGLSPPSAMTRSACASLTAVDISSVGCARPLCRE